LPHVTPQSVSAGTVSFVALNHGTVTHEPIVLPLASSAAPGSRTVGAGNRVSEDGSLGEASNDRAASAGEGIAPGHATWATMVLKPGRYEVVCNLPGHYAAGMYASWTSHDSPATRALAERAPSPGDAERGLAATAG